ncbi:MAG: helix-hairpin-helix domain-containing protein [Peptococcaceae bacterium]|nr:helix-hairpin-helix domain-containing protein [Peptococcaceae bacterium]
MPRIRTILPALCLAVAWLSPAAQATPQGQPNPAGSTASKPVPPPVNLNTATLQQLEALPGIGPRTAARIVEYREKHGPFKKVEELMNVQGIGEKSFLRLKNQLSVSTPATPKS